jgi:hypothetical protein
MRINIQFFRVVKRHPHEKWKVGARGLPYKQGQNANGKVITKLQCIVDGLSKGHEGKVSGEHHA